jgi:hypothetical protein
MVVIKLNELHMYMVSHMVNYIHYNSYDLSNSIHSHKNTLSYNELQMVIAIQKTDCKASYKSVHFFIVFIIPLSQNFKIWKFCMTFKVCLWGLFISFYWDCFVQIQWKVNVTLAKPTPK